MGSIAPEFLQRPAAPFPQAGPEEQLAAIQNWNMEYDALPPIVQWEPENDAAGTAWDLQEQQLDFMTKALDAEVSDHNKTRMRSQRYLIQSLAFERSLFKEQNYARYLNSLNHGLKMQVQDLKMQLQDEQARRLAAEAEKNGLLLQRDMETEYDQFMEPVSVSDQTKDVSGDKGEPKTANKRKRSESVSGNEEQARKRCKW